MTKLYHHKTRGGAEYLTDTFITWIHNGKRGKEGTITSDTKICVRLDGQPELIWTIEQDRAELLETLSTCLIMAELQEKRHGYTIENAKIAENIRAALAQVKP